MMNVNVLKTVVDVSFWYMHAFVTLWHKPHIIIKKKFLADEVFEILLSRYAHFMSTAGVIQTDVLCGGKVVAGLNSLSHACHLMCHLVADTW